MDHQDELSILSPPLREALSRMLDGWAEAGDVEIVVQGLGDMPLDLFDRIGRELRWRTGFPGGFRPPLRTFAFWRARRAPALVWLQLFHQSGYVREAALHQISGPAPNAFMAVALVYRLNDWVPQVRVAAGEAWLRVARATEPVVAVQALLFLLLRTRDWSRWGEEVGPAGAPLDRPEIAQGLASALADGRSGPLARVLRQALRSPGMDVHLPLLLRTAHQPAVRALALRMLAAGEVDWEVGPPTVKQWIDKSLGRFRFVRRRAARPIVSPFTLAELIAIGAQDKSGQVRLAAATALSLNYGEIIGGRALAEQLATDRNRAVRERAAFLLR